MNRYSITIFTPTYNRAHTLPALYQSLCYQDSKDFEWIVIDDGSTDNTKDLIEGWIKENKISIRYFYQENAGKMAAHNYAVDIAESELFMCLDSDDRLSKNAIESCVSFWKDKEQEVCGFITYKDISGHIGKMPIMKMLEKANNIFAGKTLHVKDLQKSGLMGETAFVVKTDILRKHKFPVFEGEKFVTDAYLWEKLDSKYSFYVFTYISQVCTYNPDGYSFNYRRLLFSNPMGYRAYHDQRLGLKLPGMFRSAVCYDAISMRMGFKGFLHKASSPLLCVLVLPVGLVKYLIDSYQLKTFKSLC